MTRTGFWLLLVMLPGCLDFDVFRTEPSPTSSSSSSSTSSGAGGTGGAGAAGGDGGAGGMTTDGGGGTGGGGLDLPPCGDLQDNFDGGPELTWNIVGGAFAQDAAQTQPPQTLFRLTPQHETLLQECSLHVQFVDTVNNGQMYFEWSLTGNFSYVFRILTNDQNMTRIDLTTDAGMLMNPPLLDPTPFVTGWARISNHEGDFRIETAPAPAGPWSLRAEVLAAAAPAWLSQPGVAEFGIYNASGNNAEFDNFNTP